MTELPHHKYPKPFASRNYLCDDDDDDDDDFKHPYNMTTSQECKTALRSQFLTLVQGFSLQGKIYFLQYRGITSVLA